MKKLLEKVVTSGFALSMLLLGGVGAESYLQVQQSNENRRSVQHTYEVLESIYTALDSVEDVGRGQRSYVFSNGKDAAARAEFGDSAKKTDRAIAQVRQSTQDNSDHQRRLDVLEPLIARRLALLQQSINLVQQNPTSQSAQTAISKQSLSLYREIESNLQALITAEQTLLEQRSAATDISVQRALWGNGLGNALGLSLLIGIFSLLLHQIRVRYQAEIALQQANDRLEANVQNRTVELAQVNASLQTELMERKLAAQALLASEKQLRLITDALPVLISYLDLEQRYRFNNRTYEEWFGTSQKDLTGRSLREVVGESAYQTIRHHSEAALAGQSVSYESLMPYQYGTRWIHATYIPDFGERGSVRGYFALISDIAEAKRHEAERKQIEEQIRQSEERLSLAIEGSGMATWDVDIQADKVLWSEQHFKLLGYDPVPDGEVMLEKWRSRVHPEDMAKVRQVSTQAQRERSPYRLEHRIIRADNAEVVWVAAFGRVVYNETGQAVRLVGILLDISDRKQAEAALQQMNEELEIKVQERTAELNHANQDLTRSNQELEQFAYIASHDLQEPLRAVIGYTQLLAKDYTNQLDKTGQQYAIFVVEGAARMQQLIQDLLEYSHIGTRDLVLAPTDCNAMLKRVLDHLQVAIAESNATITYDPLPTVTADKIQLTQLFQNLIGNAIKFRREKLPRIHINANWSAGEIPPDTQPLAPNSPEWLFSIRDNGIGIKPRYLERIFEIFKRLHTRREFPGTGIGLAICKKIVDRHKGRIWAESEPGTGTTFYFTIPNPPIQHEVRSSADKIVCIASENSDSRKIRMLGS